MQLASQRKHKFRKILLTAEELQTHGPQLYLHLAPFVRYWQEGHFHDAEMAGLYILIFLQHLSPHRWCLGDHPHSFIETLQPIHQALPFTGINLMQLPLPLAQRLPIPTKLLQQFPQGLTTLQLFARKALRGIPRSIHQTLLAWGCGAWNLQLTTTIPSPLNILKKQAQGTRVVTMVVQEEQLQSLVLGERDPLGFILHDLIHAERFFSHPRLFGPQKGFFRAMDLALEQGFFRTMMQVDSAFKEDLEYVLSDMNAYCVHQLKYLQAIVFHFFLRKNKLGTTGMLAAEEKKAYGQLLLELFSFWQMPPMVLEGALSINSPSGRGVDGSHSEKVSLLLENFFLNF